MREEEIPSESVVERRRNYHSFLGSFTRSLVPRPSLPPSQLRERANELTMTHLGEEEEKYADGEAAGLRE